MAESNESTLRQSREMYQPTILVPVLGLKNEPPVHEHKIPEINYAYEPESDYDKSVKEAIVAEIHDNNLRRNHNPASDEADEFEVKENVTYTSVAIQCNDYRTSISIEKFQISQNTDDDGCACFGKREKPAHRGYMSRYYIHDDDHEVNSVPSYGLIILLAFLLLLGYVAYAIDSRTFTGLSARQAGYDKFSEERAWADLREIVGTAPRVASSPYHLQKTIDLMNLVDNIANESTAVVHTDWQLADGDYYLALGGGSFVNSYQNVSNILALVEGESGFNADGTTNSTIVFNCHYDSVPTSYGASDNAIFCAVMTEVFRLLSKSAEKPLHNVLFLFNGAEENPLQGVHGAFQHRWTKGITAVANLDSNGMNGRPTLFQSSDSRVLEVYGSEVAAPQAQSLAEMIFQSGLIPSDTDFRLFRDFGEIYGVDIAFTRNSHVYHTVYDSLHLVQAGTVQGAGELVLPMAKVLMNTPQFEQKIENGTYVYYDYLSSFMLHYSLTAATIVDLLIAILAIMGIVYTIAMLGLTRKRFREFGWCLLGQFLSVLIGAGVTIVLIAIAASTMMQLRYLDNQWLVPFIFWVPFIFGVACCAQGFHAWRVHKSGLNRVSYSCLWASACRCWWSVVALISLAWPSLGQGRYIITLPLLYSTILGFIISTLVRVFRINAGTYLIIQVLLSIPMLLWTFTLALIFDATLVPNLARSTTAYPDLLLAILNICLALVSIMVLSGVELLFSRAWLWLVGTVITIMTIIFIFLPVFPYSGNYNNPSPQRYYLYHTDYKSYAFNGTLAENTTGLWATHIDVNTPKTLIDAVESSRLHATEMKTDFTQDCASKMFCGLPMMLPRYYTYVDGSVWLNMGAPNPPTPEVSLVMTDRICAGNICEVNLTMNGNFQGSVAISPYNGVELLTWTLETPPTYTNSYQFDSRPVYYIWRSKATYSDDPVVFNLGMTLSVTSTPDPQTSPIMTVSHTAFRLYHKEEFTAEYNDLISIMPDYFQIAPYIAFRSDYEL